MPAAYLGSDPRKHWKGSKEVSKGRKRGVSEQVITVGSWSSRLLGKLGSVEHAAQGNPHQKGTSNITLYPGHFMPVFSCFIRTHVSLETCD